MSVHFSERVSLAPKLLLWRGLSIPLLVVGTIAVCVWFSPNAGVSRAGVNMDLPIQVSNLKGKELPVSESELAILPSDTEFAKMLYEGEGVPSVSCQIVLAGAEKRSIHRPEVCLPAQGWSIRGGATTAIPLANGGNLDVMKLSLMRPIPMPDGTKKDLESLYYYWFVGKDSTTPHHFTRILKTNLDMLLHNKNHRWAYIIVSAPVLDGFAANGLNREQTAEQLEAFIGEIAPQIMKEQPEA